MKIKVISRSEDTTSRERITDLHRIQRNPDPVLHPFERAREYTRALNATKLERVFAKPFVGALSGHSDGVYSLAKHPHRLNCLLSGACDGEVRIWNLSNKETNYSINAHRGFVRGVCVSPLGDYFITVGEDKTVKQWKLFVDHEIEDDGEVNVEKDEPITTYLGKAVYTGVDHHWKNHIYATSGAMVDIWDEHRSEPIRSFNWGVETVNSVKFNPIETSVLASTAADRNIALYDLRAGSALRKVVLAMRCNAVAWNPMEAFNFTAASEDNNLYTFDMRKLDRALNVHKDHVSAVLDIDYAPTGKEFVTGAYDRSLRIYGVDQGHSREVYYGKRMQRIFCVKWSQDNKYVMSGSDETNIRLWKARAAEKIATLAPRERAAFEYNEKLKERFKYHPEIKRIARHRHLPKAIYKAKQLKTTVEQAEKVREDNKRRHSAPGTVPFKKERSKQVVTVLK
eukprot:Colp12_sorted_trinity150504_noHs@6414